MPPTQTFRFRIASLSNRFAFETLRYRIASLSNTHSTPTTLSTTWSDDRLIEHDRLPYGERKKLHLHEIHSKTDLEAALQNPWGSLGGSLAVPGGSLGLPGGPWEVIGGFLGVPGGALGGLRGALGGSWGVRFLFFGRWICQRYNEILIFLIFGSFSIAWRKISSVVVFDHFWDIVFVNHWGKFS